MANLGYLYLLIRCALGYDDLSKHKISLSDETLAYLYNAARVHSLYPIISKVIIENGLVEKESGYYQPFRKQMLKFVCRRENYDFVLNMISAEFNKFKIPFMPLKGSVLKEYYPEPWMRTGTDIDILVKKEDLEKAANILENELKLNFVSKSSHDVVYITESKVRVELHYSLNEPGYKEFQPLKGIWSVAIKQDDGYLHKMPNEYFYTYHIAHMAKHFVCGGCGLRYIIDTKVILDNLEIDQNSACELIEQCGIDKFEATVKNLCDVIFADKKHTDVTEAFEHFILTGGTFGSLANKSAIGQAKKGSGFKYALSRIILPQEQISNFYPILKTKKWLTPIYQIKRWCRIIFCGGMGRSVKELDYSSITDEKSGYAKILVENLDL